MKLTRDYTTMNTGDEYFMYQSLINLFWETTLSLPLYMWQDIITQQEGFTQGCLCQKQTSFEIRMQKLSSALHKPQSPLTLKSLLALEENTANTVHWSNLRSSLSQDKILTLPLLITALCPFFSFRTSLQYMAWDKMKSILEDSKTSLKRLKSMP